MEMSSTGPPVLTSSHNSSDSKILVKKSVQTPRRHAAEINVVTQGADLPPNSELEKLEEQELKYGAAHVIHLFVPVSLCMAAVILTMLTVGYYSRDDGVYLVYTPFTKQTDSASEHLLMSIGNALILLTVVIIMTIVLILLYKFRFYKVIHGWLMFSSVLLLSLFTGTYLVELFKNYNLSIDYLTFGFILWNWACVGMICIHWKGPLLLQQFYLIIISALMALIFIKYLPDWTVWTVLAALSIWDLVAVLCPKGPLRILVETAQQRNEPIFPALIYSSGILYSYVIVSMVEPAAQAGSSSTTELLEMSDESQTDNPPNTNTSANTATSHRIAPSRKKNTSGENVIVSHSTVATTSGLSRTHRSASPNRSAPVDTVISTQQNLEAIVEEQRGVKLGLGDFIFYSVLVGKACSFGDWNTTIACYVSILIGLAFTLMLLALFRKALPALPISIFAGITFFFATRLVITPFTSVVSMNQYLL